MYLYSDSCIDLRLPRRSGVRATWPVRTKPSREQLLQCSLRSGRPSPFHRDNASFLALVIGPARILGSCPFGPCDINSDAKSSQPPGRSRDAAWTGRATRAERDNSALLEEPLCSIASRPILRVTGEAIRRVCAIRSALIANSAAVDTLHCIASIVPPAPVSRLS